MKPKHAFVCLLCALPIALGGCGEDPKEALRRLAAAEEARDVAAYMACYDSGKVDQAHAQVQAEGAMAVFAFGDAVRARYGDAEARRCTEGHPLRSKMTDPKWIEDAQVEIDGDRATIKHPDSFFAVCLIKRGDTWKIGSGNQELFDGDEMVLRMMRAQTMALQEATTLVPRDECALPEILAGLPERAKEISTELYFVDKGIEDETMKTLLRAVAGGS